MSAVRLCGNALPPNVQNVPQLTWILAQSPEKSTRKFVFSFADYGIKKSLLNNRDSDNFVACPIADTETASITVYKLSEAAESVKDYVEKSIRILKKCGAV